MSHGQSRRPTLRRRLVLFGAPALAAAVAVVAVGLGLQQPATSKPARTAAAGTTAAQTSLRAPLSDLAVRSRALSRAAERRALAPRPPKAVRTLWTTARLDLRVAPRQGTRTVGIVEKDRRIGVTGRRSGGYSEVVVGRTARWVTTAHLSPKRVVEPTQRPLSSAPCPDGSGIEGSLQPQAVKVYRAVCAAFPELTTYGGRAPRGEHGDGRAIDIMVPSSAVGDRVKDFLFARSAALDLFDIIWSQTIWTEQRSGEGFRAMPDRGSPTANHVDHVHVKVN